MANVLKEFNISSMGSLVNNTTEKKYLVNFDMIPVMDSEGKNIIRKISWKSFSERIDLKLGDYFNKNEVTGMINGKETAIYKQGTAPDHVDGRLWMDTTITPNILYRSNGSQWIKASATQASEVGAYSSGAVDTLLTNYSSILQTAEKVALEIGQIKVGGTNLLYGSDMEELSSRNLWFKNIGTESTSEGSTNAELSGKNIYLYTTGINQGLYRVVSGLIVGQEYTFSAWVLATTLPWIIGANVGTMTSVISAGGWRRVFNTFTATSNTHTLFIISQEDNINDIYIDNVQLELGNKMTAWGLNPNEMRTAKYVFDGESAKFYDADFELWRSGVRKLYFDTVSGKYIFNGEVNATSGKIGRFDISGDDLVYTSDLFNKEYDWGDYSKLQRILAGSDTPTAYDSEVYDVNNTGTLTITDLVIIGNYVELGDPLPTPRRQIRSVIRIGTTSGE